MIIVFYEGDPGIDFFFVFLNFSFIVIIHLVMKCCKPPEIDKQMHIFVFRRDEQDVGIRKMQEFDIFREFLFP